MGSEMCIRDSYKDGTEPGTRDCRWFAAIYFLGRIIIMYIIFGISEGEICYALTGVSMILLGALLIVVQPYKSTKVNTYHTILVLYVAVSCLSITALNVAIIKAHRFVEAVIAFIGVSFILPTLVAMAYVTSCISYRCYKVCHGIWKMLSVKHQEFDSLMQVSESKHEEDYLHSKAFNNYQAVSTEECKNH